ncbi:hypothetical protein [Mesobacillus harenae]|uniref:hypothetical protein n=1 Tax=Mesobacillus harenae TaxID=2213203 RepID=UPI00157FD462|nr:hypothetical protein [Mesobacillus harenae]
MVDVVILSENQHVQKSLTILLETEEKIRIFSRDMDHDGALKALEHLDRMVVLLDTGLVTSEKLLDEFSDKHKFILYSRSKEEQDINNWISRYRVNYFNVYTNPECIIDLIKKDR